MFWISGGTNHSRLSPAGWAFILSYGSPPSAISISAVIIVINMLAMGNEWINLSPTHKGGKENEGKKWFEWISIFVCYHGDRRYIIILPSPDEAFSRWLRDLSPRRRRIGAGIACNWVWCIACWDEEIRIAPQSTSRKVVFAHDNESMNRWMFFVLFPIPLFLSSTDCCRI